MSIKRYEPNGRYSRVVENNGILYLSGLVCKNPDGDIKQQTAEVLERIEETLSKYGSDKEHILTMTLYLAGLSLRNSMLILCAKSWSTMPLPYFMAFIIARSIL